MFRQYGITGICPRRSKFNIIKSEYIKIGKFTT